MARTIVLTLFLRNGLIDLVRRFVPSEGRSAFTVRAVTRLVDMRDADLVETATTRPPVELIEAYARGWLDGVVYAASQDPRKAFDAYEAEDYITEVVSTHCSAVAIVPVQIGGREWVRRARPMDRRENLPGSATFSARWPESTVEALHESVPHDRSASFSKALWEELTIVSYSVVNLPVTEETILAFRLGLKSGIQHGSGLRPAGALDPAQSEILVAREIAAYVLEPLLAAGRRRMQRRRAR